MPPLPPPPSRWCCARKTRQCCCPPTPGRRAASRRRRRTRGWRPPYLKTSIMTAHMAGGWVGPFKRAALHAIQPRAACACCACVQPHAAPHALHAVGAAARAGARSRPAASTVQFKISPTPHTPQQGPRHDLLHLRGAAAQGPGAAAAEAVPAVAPHAVRPHACWPICMLGRRHAGWRGPPLHACGRQGACGVVPTAVAPAMYPLCRFC